MKTRSLLIPAALVLGAVLAACGGSSNAPDDATQPAASPAVRATQAASTPTAVNTAEPEASPTLPAVEPSSTPATGHAPGGAPTAPPPPPAPTNTPVPPPPPPPPPAQTQFVTVAAQNARFNPSQATVQNGVPVSITFDNQDAGVAHDLIVYTPAGGIAGQAPVIVGAAQASFAFTPGGAGNYFFKCSLHPLYMTGTIVVTP